MTIAEQIMQAVAVLAAQSKNVVFSREDIRLQASIEPEIWQASFSPVFQGMREDQPGGAPNVGAQYKNVFRRVQHGKHALTDYGLRLIGQKQPVSLQSPTKQDEEPSMDITEIDVESNIQRFLQGDDKQGGLQPEERYASFDYCFNYFQSFREADALENLTSPDDMQQSCLQIGFYLASWGMLRGSTFLLQKSAKFYEPLIRCIATSEPAVWSIDVDQYTEENIDCLIRCEQEIIEVLRSGGPASPTLVTKIMLGVFGNVPAFDNYLVNGLGIRWTGKRSLKKIAAFYNTHKEAIDGVNISTLDFATGKATHRQYPKAKVIDMIGFIQGQSSSASSDVRDSPA